MIALGPFLPWVLLGGVLAWAGSLAVMYHEGKEAGRDEIIAAQARDTDIRAETLDVAQSLVAGELSRIDSTLGELQGSLQTALRRDARYRDCRHTADGMRAVQAAFETGQTGGAGARSDPAAARDVRRKTPAAR